MIEFIAAWAACQLTSRVPASRRYARGVSMLEYAILAVAIVIVGLLFRTQLGNALSSVFARVSSFINNTN